uniref:Uncharacterized protein n=1 Tax=Caenorhabditis japonica TaxID=281687 RepID=A0A8R1ISI3_CAEJA
MGFLASLTILSVFPILQLVEAKIEDKIIVGILTVSSTIVFFIFSLIIFILSLYSFWINRRIRRFQLTDAQTHVFYRGKGKKPKLKRKVIQAMDNGDSAYKRRMKKLLKRGKKSKMSNKSDDTTSDSDSSFSSSGSQR